MKFRFIASRQEPDAARTDIVASIPVENRRKAVIDLSKMLTGELLSSQRFTFRRLSDKQLRRFRDYTNASDIDELNFARNIMRLSAAFPSSRPSSSRR